MLRTLTAALTLALLTFQPATGQTVAPPATSGEPDRKSPMLTPPDGERSTGGGASGTRLKPPLRATLFNPDLDVKAAIDAAMARGASDRRRVLVIWGDNASRWSVRMQEALAVPETARQIRHHYELVLADVAGSGGGFGPLNAALAKTFGADLSPAANMKPYMTVIETIGPDAGKSIVNRSSAGLEKPGASRSDGAYNAALIQEFLRTHRLPLLAGNEVLEAAKARARTRGVPLLVFFNDLEEYWCGRFAAWLKQDDVAQVLGSRFEVVVADFMRWSDGTAIFTRFGGEQSEAAPWYVVVDADEKRLAPDPAHGEKDLGYPTGDEIKRFIAMLRRVSPQIDGTDAGKLETALTQKPATKRE